MTEYQKAKTTLQEKEMKKPSLWDVTGISREEYEEHCSGNGNYYFKVGHPFRNKYFIEYINWSEEYGNGSEEDYDKGELELKPFPIVEVPEYRECIVWENGKVIK